MSKQFHSADFFAKEAKRLLRLAKGYVNDSNQINSVKKAIVREEFFSGGTDLLRGYYNPSKILDIVVSGINRGKALKQNAKTSTFVFGFDSHERLISSVSPYNDEVIFYKDNVQFGVVFDKKRTMMEYCLETCYHEGMISVYTQAEVFPYSQKIFNIHREEYRYSDTKLIVDWYDWLDPTVTDQQLSICRENLPLFVHDQYIFQIENGLLKNYSYYEYNADGALKKIMVNGTDINGRSFDVCKKISIFDTM